MDDILKKIIDTVLGGFSDFFRDISLVFSDPNVFFKEIKNNNDLFLNSSFYALFVTSIIAVFRTPSFLINDISTDAILYISEIVYSWFIFFICGFFLWIVCRFLLRGTGSFVHSVSAFFYASVVLSVISFLEIPTRIARDEILIRDGLALTTAENMTTLIHNNPYLYASEISVALGYLFFLFLLLKMVKSVHGFGIIRSITSVVISFVFISLFVSWLQRPINYYLLMAFHN